MALDKTIVEMQHRNRNAVHDLKSIQASISYRRTIIARDGLRSVEDHLVWLRTQEIRLEALAERLQTP